MTKPLPTPEEIQAGIDAHNEELLAIHEAGFRPREVMYSGNVYSRPGSDVSFWFNGYHNTKRPWELFPGGMQQSRRYATIWGLLKAIEKMDEAKE
jgi:hypothetical protein